MSINSDQQYVIQEIVQKTGRSYYQLYFTILFGVQWIISAFVMLTPQILYQSPILKCYNKQTNSYFECDEDNGGCDQQIIQVFNPEVITATNYYKLYCDKRWLRNYFSANTYLGGILGVSLISYFADSYGRAKVLSISFLLFSLLSFINYFVSTVYLELIIIFMLAGIILGVTNLHFTFVNESSENNIRQTILLILMICYPIGSIIFAFVFRAVQNYKNTNLFLVIIPSLILNFFSFLILQETPLYLYVKKKNELLKTVIMKIASFNFQSELKQGNFQIQQNTEQQQDNNKKIFSYIDLFRYKSIRYVTIGSAISFLAAQNIYYGINFCLEQIGLDLYYNTLFVELGEVVGYFIYIVLIHRTKRKKWSIIGLFTTSLFCFAFIFIKLPKDCQLHKNFCSQKYVQLVLATLAKLLIAVVFSMIQIYQSELFPTVVRSLSMGFIFAVGLLGVLIIPYLVELAKKQLISPMVYISIFGFLGSFGILLCRETLNQPLEDNIEELKTETYVKQTLNVNYEEHVEEETKDYSLQQQQQQQLISIPNNQA